MIRARWFSELARMSYGPVAEQVRVSWTVSHYPFAPNG